MVFKKFLSTKHSGNLALVIVSGLILEIFPIQPSQVEKNTYNNSAHTTFHDYIKNRLTNVRRLFNALMIIFTGRIFNQFLNSVQQRLSIFSNQANRFHKQLKTNQNGNRQQNRSPQG